MYLRSILQCDEKKIVWNASQKDISWMDDINKGPG